MLGVSIYSIDIVFLSMRSHFLSMGLHFLSVRLHFLSIHLHFLFLGCTSGIGAALALECSKRDATVILACRDRKRIVQIMADIRSATMNAKLHHVALDLSRMSSVRDCVSECISRWSFIDVVVNNAGGKFANMFLKSLVSSLIHDIRFAICRF